MRSGAIPSVRTTRRILAAKVAMVAGAVIVGNMLMASRVTEFEARAAAWFVALLGVDGIDQRHGTNLVRVQHGVSAFLAKVSPSCSSLTSVVALAGLSVLVLGGSLRRKLLGGLLAAMIVAVGNLFRIAFVLYVGKLQGVSALVLFHDWVGTMFSVGYTLIGFMVLIMMRLPSSERWEADPPSTFGL